MYQPSNTDKHFEEGKMKSDGSKRDLFQDKTTKRFSGVGHTIIHVPETYERTWEGHVIHFTEIFGVELICLPHVRKAVGYNCHCNTEEKSSNVCIVNGWRFGAADDFANRNLELYPWMNKQPLGKDFITWVRSGYEGSTPARHNKPELFFGVKRRKDEPTQHERVTSISNHVAELLREVKGKDIRNSLIALIEQIESTVSK